MAHYTAAMSKAFTRESDDESADDLTPARPQASPGATNYITREGADRLRRDLDNLLAQKRLLANQSAEGDANAKSALQKLDLAIQKLQATMASVIVAERPADQTRVAFGASVCFRDESGEEETYQVVGVDEAAPDAGRISSASPLAKALLTRRVGEKVRFDSPAGPQELTILSVCY